VVRNGNDQMKRPIGNVKRTEVANKLKLFVIFRLDNPNGPFLATDLDPDLRT